MCRGNVEVWLGELLTMQQKSLLGIIREAYEAMLDPNFDLLRFLHEYIAQVGLVCMPFWNPNVAFSNIYIYPSHCPGAKTINVF